jgi:hypothetical protein
VSRLLWLAFGSLWLSVVVCVYVLTRTIGWTLVKQHRIAMAILLASLLAGPVSGVLLVARPQARRLLAWIERREAPPIRQTADCSMFPANNIWNAPVRALPVDPASSVYVQSIGQDLPLHADFSVPYAVTGGEAPDTSVSFLEGAAESDHGPYRLPEDAHVLVLDEGACRLYELYAAQRTGPREWQAQSGAIFDLRSNRLRPEGWTSADAAGLPILPGLVRYDEVKQGTIRHALRFTARQTRRHFTWPARHFASASTDSRLPPMGQRFRLRASLDISSFSRDTQVILAALQTYGMFLADNGGSWYLTGAADSRWERAIAAELKTIKGADFEAVDSSPLLVHQDSGEVRH